MSEKKHIPTTASPLVSNDNLFATMQQLDAAISDILEAGTAKEATYQDKAELVRRIRELDTEIQLVEANAVMSIEGVGKDARGRLPNGQLVSLTNDAARDAFRRSFSADLRTEQTKAQAQVAQLDVMLARANDAYTAKQEAFSGIRAKANLQAAILGYLT